MKRDKTRRTLLLVLCIIVIVFITALLLTDPDTGIKTNIAQNTVIKNHFADTGADNAVSAVYLNYRLWDSLFEALVLLVSAVAVISFSRSQDDEG